LYGTSVDAVKHIVDDGKVCILDININGAKAIKKTNLDARFFFIFPPGDDPLVTLRKRLKGRGTDTDEQIERRLAIGKEELKFFKENDLFFDFVVVNDTLEESYAKLKNFLKEDL